MYEEILFKAGLSIREVNVYSLLCNQGELMAFLRRITGFDPFGPYHKTR